MANAARIAGQLRRHTAAELEALACDVESRYMNREYQCTTLPMHKRGPSVHRTPKTSLIALAAQRMILRKKIISLVVKHKQDDLSASVEDLESIAYLLESYQSEQESEAA